MEISDIFSNFATANRTLLNPLKQKIMTLEVATYCLAAISNFSANNPNQEIKVTTKHSCLDQAYLEVFSKDMSEEGYISTRLLKTMESIAEAWGGWAHVEYDRETDELLIILS